MVQFSGRPSVFKALFGVDPEPEEALEAAAPSLVGKLEAAEALLEEAAPVVEVGIAVAEDLARVLPPESVSETELDLAEGITGDELEDSPSMDKLWICSMNEESEVEFLEVESSMLM
jgi:hypothetical protein